MKVEVTPETVVHLDTAGSALFETKRLASLDMHEVHELIEQLIEVYERNRHYDVERSRRINFARDEYITIPLCSRHDEPDGKENKRVRDCLMYALGRLGLERVGKQKMLHDVVELHDSKGNLLIISDPMPQADFVMALCEAWQDIGGELKENVYLCSSRDAARWDIESVFGKGLLTCA